MLGMKQTSNQKMQKRKQEQITGLEQGKGGPQAKMGLESSDRMQPSRRG